jgi:putative thioredoxin
LAEAKEIQEVKTQLALKAEAAAFAGRAEEVKARLAADPNDHQARYDLAMAAYAAGNVEDAMDGLLEIARRDRSWNEDGARTKLLELFDAIGPADKRVLAARRKLSSLLFS